MPIAVRASASRRFATWSRKPSAKWARDDSARPILQPADPATPVTARGHNDTLEGTIMANPPRRQRPRDALMRRNNDHRHGWRRFVYSHQPQGHGTMYLTFRLLWAGGRAASCRWACGSSS